MALPGSGPLSMSMVRTEMSQSNTNNYSMYNWVNGNWYQYYSPINVFSSSSRFTESNPICNGNYSMSAWYNYDHSLTGTTATTYSLYFHSCECNSATMMPIEVGTTNVTLSFNVSGSLYTGSLTTNIPSLYIYYGKPWTNDATWIGITSLITQSYNIKSGLNASYTYNYTYNASSGSKIYFLVWEDCTPL